MTQILEFITNMIYYGVIWDLFYVFIVSLVVTTLVYYFRERATKKIVIDLGKDMWIIRN
jgi:hypothetical protein